MKAIKITTDDVISVVDIQEPTLKGMQEQVGGNIEVVRPFGFTYLNVPNKLSLVMIANEEGLCIQLPLNLLGTRLYNYPELDDEQPIVGDILIMAEGFVDGEPDIVGLTNEQTIVLYRELKANFNFLTEKKCRVCGCTDISACPGGCYWVEDDLCSECVEVDEEIEIEIEEDPNETN
jgi:hypothetical protein